MSEAPEAPRMRLCTTCGNIVRQDAKKCEHCNEVQYERQCAVCGANMPYRASYCNACKSYQNWRRHIGVSQTTLALLVALISMVTPMLKEISDFARRDSNTTVAFQSATEKEITVNVLNTGKSRSLLRRFRLVSGDHRILEDADLDVVANDSKLTVLRADDEMSIRLKPLTGLTAHKPYEELSDSLRNLEMTLVIDVQESTGIVELRRHTFPAVRIERFILEAVPPDVPQDEES
jgi:hypothetical protein